MARGGSTDVIWVRVWDPFVRLFHWCLVLAFATAYVSANRWDAMHTLAGYTAGGLVLLRVVWGVIGTPYARFSNFVRSPGAVIAYLKAILTGSEARHVGHNPAGGAMILALIAGMAGTAATGWLLTTDAFWGDTLMQHLHHWSAHAMLLLIAVHLGGVMLASFRHRENLVLAMILGRKRVEESSPAE